METAPLNALSPTSSLPSVEPSELKEAWKVLPPISSRRARIEPPPPSPPTCGDEPARFAGMAAKRLIDVTGAAAALLLLGPLFLVIALWVALDSRGPVLFRQQRLGRYGRRFWILKFRTMRPDAEHTLATLEAQNEAARGVLFKMRNDPRVTRLGRFLRRTNLDELPQLFNVLKGEMSLVGPRPFQMRDCEKLYAMDPDAFSRRLELPPGLTGAWQVLRSSPVDSEHLLEFDLKYVENWSLGNDLWILYRTVFIIIAGFRRRG